MTKTCCTSMKKCCVKYAPYALLPGRIILGVTFIMASLGKFKDPAGFVQTVQSLAPSWLPDSLANLYGYALPYFEIATGVLLIVGLFTWIAALIGSLILISFIIAIGPMETQASIPNKDFAYLAITLALLMHGAGMLSLDDYFKKGHKNEMEEDMDNEE